jgi:hypothetical protein
LIDESWQENRKQYFTITPVVSHQRAPEILTVVPTITPHGACDGVMFKIIHHHGTEQSGEGFG